jgi:hypothetical protein
MQIVKNQYVRKVGFACCVLSHVPSRWPYAALVTAYEARLGHEADVDVR